MNSPIQQPHSLHENIVHTTENRPYSMHYTKVPSQNTCALYLHWHAEYEFFYVTEGAITFILNQRKFILEAGQALIIPPFILHQAKKESNTSCAHYAFVFSPTYLLDSVSDGSYLTYFYQIQTLDISTIHPITGEALWEQHFLSLLKSLFSFYQKPIKSCELAIHGHFLLLCQELMNHFIPKPLEPNFTKCSNQLLPALHYIHEHYQEELSLKDLAAIVYLSKEQFCRLFKKLTHVSAFYYLNRYRIQKSCEYLMGTDKKIAEIASLCGFNNISYFNREFKKYMKMSPGQYRQTIQ